MTRSSVFTIQQLREVMGHTQATLVQPPTAIRLPGSPRSLTEGERLGYAYVRGVLMTLGLDIECQHINQDVQ